MLSKELALLRARAIGAELVLALALFLIVALVVARPSLSAETAATIPSNVFEVHIDNFAFTPVETTVAVGTTVRWVNRDDIPHSIAEKGLSFRSKALDTDETFSMTFNTPGVVDYFCSLHPHMTGRIIVK